MSRGATAAVPKMSSERLIHLNSSDGGLQKSLLDRMANVLAGESRHEVTGQSTKKRKRESKESSTAVSKRVKPG